MGTPENSPQPFSEIIGNEVLGTSRSTDVHKLGERCD
jgi:hypothetical protein